MKKLFFMLTTLCALFTFMGLSASADYSVASDDDGSVTGVAGATYYNVSSWSDMFEAYEDSYDSMVYLNVTGDIDGSKAAYNGQEITEGKSLTIIGNGHTLLFGRSSDPTDSTYVSDGSSNKTSGFYSKSSDVTDDTTLTLKNAKWINSINYGIFEISMQASAKTVYEDVTEANGDVKNGGTPIVNRAGTVEFRGTNVFNITGSERMNYGSGKVDPTTFGSSSFNDSQSNWIHGGNNVVVASGSTTVNGNSSKQNLLYHFDSTYIDSTLTVKNGAQLYWNLDENDYLEKRWSHSKTWNIEDNAKFVINGTKNTAESGIFDSWSRSSTWTMNIGKNATVDSTIDGSYNMSTSNSNSFNVGDDSSLILNTLSSSSRTFNGGFGYGGGIHLSDSSYLLLRGGKKVYDSLSYIYLDGDGLPLKVSSNYDGSSGLTADQASGNVGISSSYFTGRVTPSYSSAIQRALPNAKYIEYGVGTVTVSLSSTKIDRAFTLTKDDLPTSYGISKLISADEPMNFIVNSNKALKSASVQVAISQNNQSGIVSYYWKDNQGNEIPLNNQPVTVWSMKQNDYQADGHGLSRTYTANYDQNHGLLMKTTNGLKVGSYYGATVDYTLSNGPD